MTQRIENVLYSTAATAQGGREGRVQSADGVIDLPLGKPGSTSNPLANPETLFAAGYAACFNGALLAVAQRADVTLPDPTTVTAEVSFGQTDDEGVGLAVAITVHSPGLEPETGEDLVQQAHAMCPYSKATRGNIQVSVALAETT